jgi:hypothetical protein
MHGVSLRGAGWGGGGGGEFVECVLFVKDSKVAHTYPLSLLILPQNFVARFWRLIEATCFRQFVFAYGELVFSLFGRVAI